MEKQQPDISTEIQTLIGSQAMQIIVLNKRVKELEAILETMENKELKAKGK
jgi:hypothetical protein